MTDSTVLSVVAPDIRARFITAIGTEWLSGRRRVGECLYRGSRDGMTPAAFHEHCNEKGGTLTLIRADVGEAKYVFGGYTSKSWTTIKWVPGLGFGSQSVACADAFLFSVVGPYCAVERFGLRAGEGAHAMYCDSEGLPRLGPCFGRLATGGSDLSVTRIGSLLGTFTEHETSQCNLGCSFVDGLGKGEKTFTGNRKFMPVEIEVYSVK